MVTDIPHEAYNNKMNLVYSIDWLVHCCKITTNKMTGVVNDFNTALQKIRVVVQTYFHFF